MAEKATAFLNAERARLVTGVRQLEQAAEQLRAQLATNADQHRELFSRIAAIDDALAESEGQGAQDEETES